MLNRHRNICKLSVFCIIPINIEEHLFQKSIFFLPHEKPNKTNLQIFYFYNHPHHHHHHHKVSSIVRGHHVYKSIWSSYAGGVLVANLDDQPEVLEYDKFAVGVYKTNEEEKWELVGQYSNKCPLCRSEGAFIREVRLKVRECSLGKIRHTNLFLLPVRPQANLWWFYLEVV